MAETLWVGWVRTRWTHWEPVTLPARECLEAALRLNDHRLPRGEKVLLPYDILPIGRRRSAPHE